MKSSPFLKKSFLSTLLLEVLATWTRKGLLSLTPSFPPLPVQNQIKSNSSPFLYASCFQVVSPLPRRARCPLDLVVTPVVRVLFFTPPFLLGYLPSCCFCSSPPPPLFGVFLVQFFHLPFVTSRLPYMVPLDQAFSLPPPFSRH